jgi:hypothetical protein
MPRNSLPFKGRVRVGMGFSGPQVKPIPIPAFPLKGKERRRLRERRRLTLSIYRTALFTSEPFTIHP